jgi:molybdopterin-guanine dinucleotide biosynthesis adapter protein
MTRDDARPTPVVCIVGRSKVGKTTVLEGLIRELKSRGYRVGTIKHHSHAGFEVDQEGKDSWRHAQAGSDHVVVAAPDKVASIRRLEHELALEELVAGMNDVDIVLAEGYKRSGQLKIEVVRAARSTEPICTPDEVMAVVTDVPALPAATLLALDDAAGLADLIVERCLAGRAYTASGPARE